MLFQQFVDDDLGCASYLVGDEDVGIAAIVDPPYAIERVLAEAAGADGGSGRTSSSAEPTARQLAVAAGGA